MVLTPHYPLSSALQAIMKLYDAQDEGTPPPRATAMQALRDIELRLEPIPQERLQQILARFFLHYGLSGEHIFLHYQQALQPYPEDLLCAAYHWILRHHAPAPAPAPADFLSFMQPAFLHRQSLARALARYVQQLEQEENA